MIQATKVSDHCIAQRNLDSQKPFSEAPDRHLQWMKKIVKHEIEKIFKNRRFKVCLTDGLDWQHLQHGQDGQHGRQKKINELQSIEIYLFPASSSFSTNNF